MSPYYDQPVLRHHGSEDVAGAWFCCVAPWWRSAGTSPFPGCTCTLEQCLELFLVWRRPFRSVAGS